MKHARPDYDPIQDPRNIIPEDEPVFLLRGQDAIAARVVRIWVVLHDAAGGDPGLGALALDQADLMDAWPRKKVADLPDWKPQPPKTLPPITATVGKAADPPVLVIEPSTSNE